MLFDNTQMMEDSFRLSQLRLMDELQVHLLQTLRHIQANHKILKLLNNQSFPAVKLVALDFHADLARNSCIYIPTRNTNSKVIHRTYFLRCHTDLRHQVQAPGAALLHQFSI